MKVIIIFDYSITFIQKIILRNEINERIKSNPNIFQYIQVRKRLKLQFQVSILLESNSKIKCTIIFQTELERILSSIIIITD